MIGQFVRLLMHTLKLALLLLIAFGFNTRICEQVQEDLQVSPAKTA